MFQYRNASTIILVIFVIVLGMEWLTDSLPRHRRRCKRHAGSRPPCSDQ